MVWDGRGLVRDVFGTYFGPQKPPGRSIFDQKILFWTLFDVFIFTKIPSSHIGPYLHIHMHIRIHMHMHLYIHIPYMSHALLQGTGADACMADRYVYMYARCIFLMSAFAKELMFWILFLQT